MDLSHLDLALNQLASLPADLVQLPGLHTLRVEGNSNLSALPLGLSNAPCLARMTLDLALQHDAEAAALAGRHNMSLQLLEVTRCTAWSVQLQT